MSNAKTFKVYGTVDYDGGMTVQIVKAGPWATIGKILASAQRDARNWTPTRCVEVTGQRNV